MTDAPVRTTVGIVGVEATVGPTVTAHDGSPTIVVFQKCRSDGPQRSLRRPLSAHGLTHLTQGRDGMPEGALRFLL